MFQAIAKHSAQFTAKHNIMKHRRVDRLEDFLTHILLSMTIVTNIGDICTWSFAIKRDTGNGLEEVIWSNCFGKVRRTGLDRHRGKNMLCM
jgi:hypothetical protein